MHCFINFLRSFALQIPQDKELSVFYVVHFNGPWLAFVLVYPSCLLVCIREVFAPQRIERLCFERVASELEHSVAKPKASVFQHTECPKLFHSLLNLVFF